MSTTPPAASSAHMAPGRAFELREAKLRPPRTGRRSVPRRTIEQRLADTAGTPIVVVCAGAGYGKTTTLVRWAATAGRPVAWVSLDGHDNDPVTLLTYVAEAMDRQVGIDASVFLALGSPGASMETMVIPRLGTALAGLTAPLLLILDDVHAVTDDACIDALVALALHVPAGVQIVLSTRDASMLPLGVWRTRGLCVEVGPQELRMDGPEARALLDATVDGYSDEDVAELVRRTEGWPAGLYLAGLSAGAAGVEDPPATLSGNDPLVADFLRSELLAAIPSAQLAFLTRASLLEPLSGPLCDAALQRSGSAELLETLERTNRFVVALDRERTHYRCHHLVRDLLAEELARTAPDELAPVRLRASDWCLANGRIVEGVGYAQAAGDVDRVAAGVLQWAQPVLHSGRVTTVHRWFCWLWDHGAAERHPAVAVLAGLFYATEGDPAECDRWTAAIKELDLDEDPLLDGMRALLRALRCVDGVDALQRDAALAVQLVSPIHTLRASALLMAGLAATVTGDTDRADDIFVDAAGAVRSVAAISEAPVVLPVSIAERALLAVGRGEWVAADTLAQDAVHISRHSRLAESPSHAIAFAVAARTALQAERSERAHEYLTEAQRRLPDFNHVTPVPAVQARLEMARCYLQLADHAGARTMLSEIDGIERRTAGLGTLSAEAQELRSRLDAPGQDLPGVTALTAAELRVLPLLSTHLSYREIGERRFLSRHTVKSHAMAIYRKLGVSSRSDGRRARPEGRSDLSPAPRIRPLGVMRRDRRTGPMETPATSAEREKSDMSTETTATPVEHLSFEERTEVGRQARRDVPRSAHAAWEAPAGRPSPVDLLEQQATTRVPELVPLRYGRMLVSPFTFYRGAAYLMASDLSGLPRTGVTTQLCGDAHLSNFGAYAAPDRSLVFDVNDFDETLPGPFEWDLKRLVTSFAVAGRDRGLTAAERRVVNQGVTQSYRERMHEYAAADTLELWYSRIDIAEIMQRIMAEGSAKQIKRAQKNLAKTQSKDSLRALAKLTETVDGELRIRSAPPVVVPVHELFDADLHEAVGEGIRTMLRTYRSTLSVDRRILLERFRYVDAARKVVGVGSVGTRAWIMLALGRDEQDPLFLQFKEAEASVLEPFLGASEFANHGERVVQGQRLTQAATDIMLGWLRVPGPDGVERDFYVRQLWDNKGSAMVELMNGKALHAYGQLCGRTLARAHARSGGAAEIAGYLGSGDAFDRALAAFAESYADQNEQDYAVMQQAIADGTIEALTGI